MAKNHTADRNTQGHQDQCSHFKNGKLKLFREGRSLKSSSDHIFPPILQVRKLKQKKVKELGWGVTWLCCPLFWKYDHLDLEESMSTYRE